MRTRLVIFAFSIQLISGSVFSQAGAGNQEALLLHRAEKALTDVIVHDIFSPPVASRIYLYANMAAYEAIIPFQTGFRSLRASIASFPEIKTVMDSRKINTSLVAVYAFMKTAQGLIFSEQVLADSLKSLLKVYKRLPPAIYAASVRYAQQVSDSVLSWAGRDNYKETRKIRRYNFIKAEGKWSPTPPGYMAAIEPYWNKIRTMVLDSSAEFKPARPPMFGTEKSGEFYSQANAVYQAGKSMTAEQRNIALFWDCNPFFLNTQGHLNFATKKLSPGGHWISITGIAAVKAKAGIAQSAAAYVLTSIALFDGFISCWDEKYRSNLVRPETYINTYIDEQWRPLLQTPPFPEYTSGHSVISTAAAIVLTRFFGESFSFDDNTETYYGLPVRSFQSFMQAADEAAISRFYGGIHYKAAIENGQWQGRQIGEKVLARVRLENEK